MWYDSLMPEKLPEKIIDQADAAVAYAQQVRRYHRRRSAKKTRQRKQDIKLALERLKTAMKPLRSEIGRFPYGPTTATAEANRERIKEASAAIQKERRKLWKMRDAEPKETPDA